MRFTKMQGIQNDYVYIDTFIQPAPPNPELLAIQMSRPHTGVGADGIIFIDPCEGADCRMRMYNADGTPGEMCGNGVRCVARYMLDRRGLAGDTVRVQTAAGLRVITANRDETGRITTLRVDMGVPRFAASEIPVRWRTPQDTPLPLLGKTYSAFCVSLGNPHAVLFVEDPAALVLPSVGPELENHPFFPARANIEFVKVEGNDLVMRVWERGSAETLACGTGACACAVAALSRNLVQGPNVLVHLRGGDLDICWEGPDHPVFMTGPAQFVFDGEWRL